MRNLKMGFLFDYQSNSKEASLWCLPSLPGHRQNTIQTYSWTHHPSECELAQRQGVGPTWAILITTFFPKMIEKAKSRF